MMMQSREVQTQRRPACPVCGLQGKFVYRGLTDSVFHVPGEWGMKRCNHRDCRTLWLDPMPAEADLIKLYTGYYTHASPNTTTTETQMRALLDRIRTAYLHTHYGYKTSFRPGQPDC